MNQISLDYMNERCKEYHELVDKLLVQINFALKMNDNIPNEVLLEIVNDSLENWNKITTKFNEILK